RLRATPASRSPGSGSARKARSAGSAGSSATGVSSSTAPPSASTSGGAAGSSRRRQNTDDSARDGDIDRALGLSIVGAIAGSVTMLVGRLIRDRRRFVEPEADHAADRVLADRDPVEGVGRFDRAPVVGYHHELGPIGE